MQQKTNAPVISFSLLNLLDTDKQTNHIFSPYSAITAMQMVQAGVEGEALRELNTVIGDLSQRQELPKGEYGYAVANGVFYDENLPINLDYEHALKQFDAWLHLVNFNKPEPTIKVINTWIKNRTQNKIKDLLTSNSIDASTVIVLANALYFKDNWVIQFDPKQTTMRAFSTPKGDKPVSMMQNTANYEYTVIDGVQILRLPYSRGCSMMVYLPPPNDSSKVFPLMRENVDGELHMTKVHVQLPKFKIEKKMSLVPALQHLGVHEVFHQGKPDFSKIFAQTGLQISDVVQGLCIEVDEVGTEAAVATAVMVTRGFTPRPPEFIANRPFAFSLNAPDGTALFNGFVRNP